MPKPTVYLDSTIPSAYFDDRPQMTLRRDATQAWWAHAQSECHLISSTFLKDEIGRGSRRDRAEARVQLIRHVPLVGVSREIRELADWYIDHKLMPASPDADAIHLATATLCHCEYLATWNFGHLVNRNKAVHLSVLNGRRGLSVPLICTPWSLMGNDDEFGTG